MCRIIPPLTDAEKIVEIYGHSMHQLSVVETTESTSTSPPPLPYEHWRGRRPALLPLRFFPDVQDQLKLH